MFRNINVFVMSRTSQLNSVNLSVRLLQFGTQFNPHINKQTKTLNTQYYANDNNIIVKHCYISKLTLYVLFL